MTLVLLLSAGIGFGVYGVVASLKPSRPSLAGIILGLSGKDESRHVRKDRLVANWRVDRRLGDLLAASLGRRRRPGTALRLLLAQADVSFEDFCSDVVLGGAAGLLVPPLCWAVLRAGGLHLIFVVPLWASLVMCAIGCLFPLATVRAEARRGQRSARRAIGAFLDLVVLGLAGGMGIESALVAAADVSDSPTSRRVAAALTLARDAGEPPWDALARLGEEIGTRELHELAAAVSLAGNEGARIRATLSAKAASIRRHEIADAEAEANAVTERLFLPGVLLLVGFLLFIGYPAYVRIMSGL